MNNNKFVEENMNVAIVLANNISNATKTYLMEKITPEYSDNSGSPKSNLIYHIEQFLIHSNNLEVNKELDAIREEAKKIGSSYILLEDMS